MHDYEKLGVFYLGRYHDPATRSTLPDPLLYNSNDLLTHALCVGMTGSGKTGLCVDLIEEAAIDGIPAILIDPKGDLANLLLTFPELRPEDFAPWINEDDARKQGVTPTEFAARQAELWQKGLAKWNQEPDRIRRLREAAEFTIFTPGSTAGVPVSILNSFAPPPAEIMEDPELLRERVNTTVCGLLGLLGIEADPLKSREAVFLSNILVHGWQSGLEMDLGKLMQEIQTPSLTRIGLMDVETFYPARERFTLATSINGLLASPGFGTWLQGEPLDIQRILYTTKGKPRVAIFSIAHLNDAERMFFVTLLLNQILGWMRTQSGTTSLRALVYMDEIFGYFPPVANPPSKLPLLTLLKQARAFGVGVALATQNPVDLDYKGLANIGTWFLGRLQTDRDKQRVLDGLEGAAASQKSSFDRAAVEQTLAGLSSRVFLLHNVHEEGLSVFESRWAMSYLRGPLTRNQIKVLNDAAPGDRNSQSSQATPARSSSAPASARVGGSTGGASAKDSGAMPSVAAFSAAELTRPTLPPTITQFFLPVRGAASITYEPRLMGVAQVRFTDAKTKADASQSYVLLTPIKDDAVPVDWTESIELEYDPNELEKTPAAGARFESLASAAAQAKNYAQWSKDLVNHLFGEKRLTLWKSRELDLVSQPGESEGDFRVRLLQAGREERDAAAGRLRAKYEPKIVALRERIRRAEQSVQKESEQASSAKLSSVLSFGTTLLGAFLGRKVISSGSISRAGSAMRSVGRAAEQSADVARATETVQSLQQQLTDLDAQFQGDVAAVNENLTAAHESLDKLDLRPGKANISVKLVCLAWTPYSVDAENNRTVAY